MKSFRTTSLGIAAMVIGLWAFKVHWVPSQTLFFNLVYVETGPLALLIVGWALIHAADHRAITPPTKAEKKDGE